MKLDILLTFKMGGCPGVPGEELFYLLAPHVSDQDVF